MARTKISEFSATAADNTDIDSIDIAEGCAPSGINNAIRELMAQLKDFQTGAAGDPFNGAVNGTLGATTPAAATVTNLAYTGTLTGGTGVINIGSGQLYKDASGNVGIGTATPNSKFEVVSAANTSAYRLSCAYGTLGEVYQSIYWNNSSFSGGNSEIRNIVNGAASTGSALSFLTSQTGTGVLTERLRIDNSGNLGLGVTPSAWGSYTGLQVKATIIGGTGTSDNALFGSNVYFDGSNFKYISSTTATLYRQLASSHQWYNAPSGTAGNAITFTQAMTLDADGELGIGLTTPNEKLHVSGAGKFVGQANSLDQAGAFIDYASSVARIVGTGASGGTLAFFTNPNGGFQAERARIDSSGNLLVGTTSAGGAGGLTIYPLGGGAGSAAIGVWNKTNTGAETAAQFRVSASTIGSISYSNTAVAYNTTSDYRLKENVRPLVGALDRIMQLEPSEWDWKSDGSQGVGFIAHKVQAIRPQAVTGTKDAVDADGKPIYQGMDASFLIADLTAALQELKTEFDAYKTAHP